MTQTLSQSKKTIHVSYIFLLLVLICVLFISSAWHATKDTRSAAVESLEIESVKFHTSLDWYQKITRVLANAEILRPLFAYATPQDLPPDFSEADFSHKLNFANSMQLDRSILQARFINKAGYELVRTNATATSIAFTPREQLQNKAARYYYKDAVSQENNLDYISYIDLNIENEVIEFPHSPVIRFASLIINPVTTQPEGIVVINVDALKMLQHLKQTKNQRLYLFDDRG
jgi:hypothetical protein